MGLGVRTKEILINNQNITNIFPSGYFDNPVNWNMLFAIFFTIFVGISIFLTFFVKDNKLKTHKSSSLACISLILFLCTLFIFINPKNAYQNSILVDDTNITIQYADNHSQTISKSDIHQLNLSGTDATCKDITSQLILNNEIVPINFNLPTFPSLFCNVDPITEKIEPRLEINHLATIDLNNTKHIELIQSNLNNTPEYIKNNLFEFFLIFFIFFFLVFPIKSWSLKLLLSTIFSLPLCCILIFTHIKNEAIYTNMDNHQISAYFISQPNIHIKKEDIQNIQIFFKLFKPHLNFIITDINNKKYHFVIKTKLQHQLYFDTLKFIDNTNNK